MCLLLLLPGICICRIFFLCELSHTSTAGLNSIYRSLNINIYYHCSWNDGVLFYFMTFWMSLAYWELLNLINCVPICARFLNLFAVIDWFQRMASLFRFVTILVAAVTVKTMAHYPFHASCKIEWLVIAVAVLIVVILYNSRPSLPDPVGCDYAVKWNSSINDLMVLQLTCWIKHHKTVYLH